MGLTDLSRKWQDNKSTIQMSYKDLSQQSCGVDVARNAGDQRGVCFLGGAEAENPQKNKSHDVL